MILDRILFHSLKKVTVASKGEVLICYREGYKKVFMKDIN